jgi:hypothetical protein
MVLVSGTLWKMKNRRRMYEEGETIEYLRPRVQCRIEIQRHCGILGRVYRDTRPCTRHHLQHSCSIREYNVRIFAKVLLPQQSQEMHQKGMIVE